MGRSPKNKHGFTLVELVVVVILLGLIAALAVPRMSTAATNAKYNATHRGYRSITTALNLYHNDHQAYPPNAPIATLPPGLEDYLHASVFTNPSPIGRAWDWNGEGSGLLKHGHNLSIHTVDEEDQIEVERRFDDGDPDTGIYRKHNQYLIWPMGY